MSFYVSIITADCLAKPRQKHTEAFLVLAYYHLTPLKDPQAEVHAHKEFFAGGDFKSRIYISNQGINGTLSAPVDDAYAYMHWMSERPEFKGIQFKVHEAREHVFPRLAVKVRKELVAYGQEIPLDKQGIRVSPADWAKMLEEEKDKVILDVRNDYEWDLGHFEGAEIPHCDTFRDFKVYVEKLKERITDKKTKVMMYCTGGIRCEFFSALLAQNGIEETYQLDGGIINYGVHEKAKHWQGKLFVFDDRLSVPLSDQETSVVGSCRHCGVPIDVYYNCSNMDYNELFLCCPDCLKTHAGCCQDECKHAMRLRPFKLAHTPFRRRHTYKDLLP
jgi:UPF0176 protein